MDAKRVFCEECVEEIPNDEVYWEDERMYCGRCGSEMELTKEASDLVDTIKGQSAQPLYSMEDEKYDEEDEEEQLEPDEERDPERD
ncbi:MAG: hypothetical protein O7E56_14035 [SAR324 cluster bacterium]|nr:hypothetical protein [SAR324 cluster bacterium]MCZ6629337.1 hypothetical protein [SAR324 cluster bacterium]MCZ6730207.1 hypothetical protein [SAR324 cluster bacterium]